LLFAELRPSAGNSGLSNYSRSAAASTTGMYASGGSSNYVGSFAIVADITFLHGFGYCPAIAILEHRCAPSSLQEHVVGGGAVSNSDFFCVSRVLTIASRLASAAHTGNLSVISVDSTERKGTILWQRDGLPHDAYALEPVPSPAGEEHCSRFCEHDTHRGLSLNLSILRAPTGGVLVLSTNAIIYVNQHSSCSIALNAFAAASVDWRGRWPLRTNEDSAPASNRAGPSQPLPSMSAECTGIEFIAPASALLSTRDGAVYILRLVTAPRLPQVYPHH
jgi:hypothetical protein